MEEIRSLSSIGKLIDSERELAREQVSAAARLHIDRVTEEMTSTLGVQLERMLDERFVALKVKLDSEVKSLVAEAVAEAVAQESARGAEETARASETASRKTTERLNQAARRLGQAEDLSSWSAAVLDAVASFVPRSILFSIFGGQLRYEGHRQPQTGESSGVQGLEVPLSQAPAFQSVLQTMDTVIALSSAGEISAGIVAALSLEHDSRVCLLPVIVGQSESNRRVAAIVLAGGGVTPLDVNVLELIVALSGVTLDARQAAQRAAASAAEQIVTIQPAAAALEPAPSPAPEPQPVPQAPPVPEPAPVPAPPPPEPAPHKPSIDWSSLSREEQELHAKAQRFARVRVAEMRLYQPQAVRQGREQKQLYLALRGEMDRGRTQFKHEFFHIPSMVDYFHLELVRTLAHDSPELLGPEYPGPIV